MAISATTAATITAVVAVAGAAVSAYGIMQQQEIASAQAKREKKAKELEAQLAMENARMQAAELQKDQQRAGASQAVAGAGAGISMDSGSLLDLMEETSTFYEKDRQQLLRTGALNAASANYAAGGYSLAAKKGPSYFKAGATLLNGISTGMSYGEKGDWWS